MPEVLQDLELRETGRFDFNAKFSFSRHVSGEGCAAPYYCTSVCCVHRQNFFSKRWVESNRIRGTGESSVMQSDSKTKLPESLFFETRPKMESLLWCETPASYAPLYSCLKRQKHSSLLRGVPNLCVSRLPIGCGRQTPPPPAPVQSPEAQALWRRPDVSPRSIKDPTGRAVSSRSRWQARRKLNRAWPERRRWSGRKQPSPPRAAPTSSGLATVRPLEVFLSTVWLLEGSSRVRGVGGLWGGAGPHPPVRGGQRPWGGLDLRVRVSGSATAKVVDVESGRLLSQVSLPFPPNQPNGKNEHPAQSLEYGVPLTFPVAPKPPTLASSAKGALFLFRRYFSVGVGVVKFVGFRQIFVKYKFGRTNKLSFYTALNGPMCVILPGDVGTIRVTVISHL